MGQIIRGWMVPLIAQVIDGGCLRQGEHIDAFCAVLSLVREFLFDDGACDHPGHCDLHVGLEGGCRDKSSGLASAKQQPALFHVVEPDSVIEGSRFVIARSTIRFC